MNRNDKSIFAIVLGIFALLWCLVVLVFVDQKHAGFDYWGGFAFGLIAILAALIANIVIKLRANRASLEISMIPVPVSITYLLFGVIFNGYFVYEKIGDHKTIIVVVNVLALVAYLVLMYYLMAYTSRVTELSDRISDKAYQITEIKSEIGVLLALCGSGEVRDKILALKTKVDYSDNLAQAVTQDEENLFFSQIKGIENLIRSKAADEDILKLISEAEDTWKIRNAKLTTAR